MKKYIIKASVAVSLAGLLCTGCTNSFDKVNTDPDRTPDASTTNVLAYVIQYSSSKLFDPWNDMNEPSTYGGQLAKIQYIDESRYRFRPSVVENKWTECYELLKNIRAIQEKAVAEKNPNMQNVGKVLEVVIMQIATDTWRDLPYSEALRMKEGILLPKYDKQEAIYPAMLELLLEAADGFKAGLTDEDAGELGEGDILFQGDIARWQKFCNSLRLRLAVRLSGVSADLAKQTVEGILQHPADYPILTENDDNAFFNWPGSAPFIEPWANDFQGTRDDYGMSDVIINRMLTTEDPRISVYAHKNAKGIYQGFTIGAADQIQLNQTSHIGARFRENGKGFTPYLRAAETYFNIAEASMLGWNTGMSAKDAYEKAVTTSLQENGVKEAEIGAFLNGKAKFDNTLEQIYWQEWIALFKQGMEAWSLYRRTGVPTTHYVAPASEYPGHNVPPLRYPYPISESTLNGANSKPFSGEVVDNFWGKPMWWDTRKGLK